MIKCSVNFCSNNAKTKGKCRKHYLREYRENNKMRYAFQNSKDNAKRRGKVFELTFEQFSKFATEVDYLKKKGRLSKSMHIDRIIESEGYTIDNIQPLENGANVRKYLDYHYDRDGITFNTVTNKNEIDNNLPF